MGSNIEDMLNGEVTLSEWGKDTHFQFHNDFSMPHSVLISCQFAMLYQILLVFFLLTAL